MVSPLCVGIPVRVVVGGMVLKGGVCDIAPPVCCWYPCLLLVSSSYRLLVVLLNGGVCVVVSPRLCCFRCVASVVLCVVVLVVW